MRLVKDHELVRGQQHRPRRQVRGVEVRVDDEQRTLRCAVLRQFGEAVLALGTLDSTETLLGRHRESAPRPVVDLERQFVPVAGLGLVRPAKNAPHLVGDAPRDFGTVVETHLPVAAHALGPIATEVVALALQYRDPHAAHVLGDGRGVLGGELVLEVLRGGRDDDALARHRGGNEVGERLADAGTGLDHGVAAPRERGRDGAHHLALSLTVLSAAGQILGDAVEQGERSLGVDRHDVVVQLQAFSLVRVDVGRFVVRIEGLHASTLRVRCEGFDSETTN